MFAFQDRRGAVEVAFTDRHGGVSGDRFASLNLGESVGDEQATVEENLDILSHAFARGVEATDDAFGLSPDTPTPRRVVLMHQVHGADVAVVDGGTARVPESDGLATSAPGVVLVVRVADCAPVLLADVEHGVVGAAHAGRLGMVAGVVPATIDKMRDLGARQIAGWVGPHVCGRCYEVPGAMREKVARTIPEAFAETSWGTPSLDLGAGVRAQLEAGGVESVDVARCTMEDEDLYSHRRQGTGSGRLAGLVWIRP